MPGDPARAAAALGEWILDRVGPLGQQGPLANRAQSLLTGESSVLRIEDAARLLGVSTRTLQRLTRNTVGLPPAAMIRRRRLQEAAQRVRDDPGASLAQIAAELGYADQAHLARDFRATLGFTASAYREEL